MSPTTGRYPFKISFLPHEVCVDPELQVNLPENLFINQIKRTAFPLSHSPPLDHSAKTGTREMSRNLAMIILIIQIPLEEISAELIDSSEMCRSLRLELNSYLPKSMALD